MPAALKSAVKLTLILSLLYILLAALFVPVIQLPANVISGNAAFTETVDPPARTPAYLLWGIWQRFDTLQYIHTARHGYDSEKSVVFYPLYSLAIRAATTAGLPAAPAAIITARLATVFAFYGLFVLLGLDLDSLAIRRTVVLFLLWPTSFILFGGYAESFLICFTVWCFAFAREGRWWPAALCCLLACLSRAVGAVAVLPLLWLMWKQKRWKPLPLALILAGPLLFPLYLKLSGLPMVNTVYPRFWRTTFSLPWTTIADAWHSSPRGWGLLLAINFGAVLLIFGVGLIRPLRPEYFWYALGTLCIILTTNSRPPMHSYVRYVLPVFPAFASVGLWLKSTPALVLAGILLFPVHAFLLYGFWKWLFVI